MPQTAKKEDKPLVKHNFNAVFKNLYQQGLRFQDNIAEVDDSVLREMNMIQNLRTDIRELKIELQQAEEKINQLVNVSNISVESSGSITKDFETFNKKQSDYGILKSKKDELLRNAEKHLIQLEGFIKDVTRGKIPKVLEDKKTILADFKIVAKSTRDRVFHQLIEQLEEEANKHFIAMTKGNQGVKGRIKLVKRDGFYIPRNVGSDGNELSNINDSDIILVKVAVILAIISARSNSRATELYTLITDAPSSKFTDNYTIGFCNRVGLVYNQSIIMSKDFYVNEALRARLLDAKQVDKLGNVYIITPSVVETNRTDRNSLSTKIQKIR